MKDNDCRRQGDPMDPADALTGGPKRQTQVRPGRTDAMRPRREHPLEPSGPPPGHRAELRVSGVR